MSSNYPSPGPQDINAYSIPGIPWVTGSTMPAASIVHVTFPFATSYFIVRHTSGSSSGNQPGPVLSVGFTANGMGTVQSNYFTLTPGTELHLPFRCVDLFLSATQGTPPYEIVAGLSMVPYKNFPVLTASVTSSALFSGVG